MLPTTMTVTTLLTDAAVVVNEFDTLIGLVAGLAIGMFVVRFLIRKIRSAS